MLSGGDANVSTISPRPSSQHNTEAHRDDNDLVLFVLSQIYPRDSQFSAMETKAGRREDRR